MSAAAGASMTFVQALIMGLSTALGSGGLVALGRAVLESAERRRGARRAVAVAEAHERTARQRIADGARARGELLLERTLAKTAVDCAVCRDELAAERREHSDTKVHLARCDQDRVHQRAINRWLVARVDKLDGGGSVPPFPLDDPEPEPAE